MCSEQRKKFEAWAADWPRVWFLGRYDDDDPQTIVNRGEYKDEHVEAVWQVWQAACPEGEELMRIDRVYARANLENLLRDLDRYNGDEFWRQMSRIADGATDHPSAEDLLNERDALAAHVERIKSALIKHKEIAYINEGMGVEQARIHAKATIPKINPATSLARRDLLKQAEGFEALADKLAWGVVVDHLLETAKDLRQQANQLEAT